MVFLKQFLLILMLTAVGLNAACQKGQHVLVKHGRRSCISCSKESYQDEVLDTQSCKPCIKCDVDSGSEIKQNCTRETNTVCRCREGFVTWTDDNSVCRCDIGFELIGSGASSKCSKCKEGYFGVKTNICAKWKNCKSAGVKVNGTATSDVICNDDLKSDSGIPTPPTPNKSVTNRRPHEGAQTLNMPAVHTTTPAPRRTTQKESKPHSQPSYTALTVVIQAIVGILLILTAVTCKMHIMSCWQRTKARGLQTKDSTCRKPVKESGDDNELPLKGNPEEP